MAGQQIASRSLAVLEGQRKAVASVAANGLDERFVIVTVEENHANCTPAEFHCRGEAVGTVDNFHGGALNQDRGPVASALDELFDVAAANAPPPG
jgi:hypothetical protein